MSAEASHHVVEARGKSGGNDSSCVYSCGRARLETKREQKAWRDWYKRHIKCVRDCILATMPPVDANSAQRLRDQLNRCTNKSMPPDFSVGGARSGYVLERLEARTAFLPEVLVQPSMRPLLDDLLWQTFNQPTEGFDRGTLVGNSYGGGPGFDVLGLALLFPNYLRPHAELNGTAAKITMKIEGRVYDNEKGWSTSVDALNLFLEGGHRECKVTMPSGQAPASSNYDGTKSPLLSTCLGKDSRLGTACFETCDITEHIGVGLNQEITKELLHRTHLHVFMYVLVENLLSVRNGNYKFVRDVFANARPGAVVCVFDSSPKMFPEIIALVNTNSQHSCEMEAAASSSNPEYCDSGALYEACVTRQTRSGWVLLLRCLRNPAGGGSHVATNSKSEAPLMTEAPLLPSLQHDVLDTFTEFSDKHKEYLKRPDGEKDMAYRKHKQQNGMSGGGGG
jgi:hypothetical protein